MEEMLRRVLLDDSGGFDEKQQREEDDDNDGRKTGMGLGTHMLTWIEQYECSSCFWDDDTYIREEEK